MRIDLHGLLTAAALLGLLPGAATPAASQTEDGRFSIDRWGAGQGLLPDDSVLALAQTHDGYLWLGTLYGLARFDGVRFTVFDESNTPKLPSIKIVRLFEDSHGNLWVGTSTAGAARIKDGRVNPSQIGRGRPQRASGFPLRGFHRRGLAPDRGRPIGPLRQHQYQMDVWNMPALRVNRSSPTKPARSGSAPATRFLAWTRRRSDPAPLCRRPTAPL